MGKDFKWGNPNLSDQRLKGLAVRRANAQKHNDRVRSLCNDFKAAGYTKTTQLVKKLAEVGVMTRKGKPYTYTNLYRVLAS